MADEIKLNGGSKSYAELYKLALEDPTFAGKLVRLQGGISAVNYREAKLMIAEFEELRKEDTKTRRLRALDIQKQMESQWNGYTEQTRRIMAPLKKYFDELYNIDEQQVIADIQVYALQGEANTQLTKALDDYYSNPQGFQEAFVQEFSVAVASLESGLKRLSKFKDQLKTDKVTGNAPAKPLD
jgi:hypothetical protein